VAAGVTLFELLSIDSKMIPSVGAGVVAVALTGVGLVVKSKLKNPENHIVPDPKPGLVNFMMSIVAYFRGLLDTIIGHGSDRYLTIVCGTFLFILFSNYSGLLPGWLPPTESLYTNLAMAGFIFVFYNLLGLKEHGFHYFKQFTGGLPPSGYNIGLTLVLVGIAGLIIVIEVVGHVFRVASLSLRLFGNMYGDHTLLGTVSGLVPLIVPVGALALGMFVGLIQALVFSLLTTVYIKLAVSHDH
jgi:F-type H+-transporting ATPase subunit a